MKKFDLINTPLTGTNLIEASAGTGKTYAISGLFLRLILEKQIPADQILVVTFTKAATDELKERIRKKLIEAKEAFSKGSGTDTFINELIKKHDNHAHAFQMLQDALVDFDKAAIFTIHGFCQRILHENAFETGSLYNTELVTDQEKLMKEVADDFWRKNIYMQPLEFISYILNNKKISGPEYFFNLLNKVKTPDIKIIPKLKEPELKSLENYRDIFKGLKEKWHPYRNEVKKLLMDPALSGTIYGGTKKSTNQPGYSKRELKIISMADDMDKFTDKESTPFPLFDKFENFTTSKIEKSTKKNQVPLSHEFFDICDELYLKYEKVVAEFEAYFLFLKSELFSYAKSQIEKRKKSKNIQFYDDLLETVRNALKEDNEKEGNALAKAIRQKYKAALVDEFQDTDPVQYEIFLRLFSTPGSVLFIIGDPKQAIYGFRGADIFSYMEAAYNADSKFTLFKNWRSRPGLITAVNTLFSNIKAPFVFDEILFEKARPGRKPDADDKKETPPLKLWYIESNEKKPINKADAVRLISTAVAGEIARITSHVKEKVQAGDIAVLVRTNRQARIIKDSISAQNVPSVLYNAGNVFDTDEAMEMERVLTSIAEPGNERRFKSALATRIMGVSGEQLDMAINQSIGLEGLETRLADFSNYFQIWKRHGFIRMFRLFMTQEEVKKRILAFTDGERRLTNILHLSEILHQESVEKGLGITGLVKWLCEQRDSSSPRLEEHQLRLESDELAVKIITIHKSKGLEFPVVFCPFGWEGSLVKDEEVVFHDINENKRLTIDLGSQEIIDHIPLTQNELLAENLRLLYVAITRAKKQCYLVWGRISKAETSAMAYLFHDLLHDKKLVKTDDIAADLKQKFDLLSDEDLIDDLKLISGRSKGTIELSFITNENDFKYKSFAGKEIKLFCRNFNTKIDRKWKVSSYSSLVSGQMPDDEFPDHDTFYKPHGWTTGSHIDFQSLSGQFEQTDYPEKNDIFSFPKGARAGIFIHDIFENLDFKEDSADVQERLVTGKLHEYGFDIKWKNVLCDMIRNVISIPLLAEVKDLTLSSISSRDRINEIEFYFPLKTVTKKKLKKIFSDYIGMNIPADFPSRLERLAFSPSEGFMKGYIDMIFRHKGKFYLVDWKSNFLGAHIKNYSKDSLEETMKEELYILQYHIYLLALHKYLSFRVPGYNYEKNFGGIFYVFIRGIDNRCDPEFGIYRDLPGQDLIYALDRELISGFH